MRIRRAAAAAALGLGLALASAPGAPALTTINVFFKTSPTPGPGGYIAGSYTVVAEAQGIGVSSMKIEAGPGGAGIPAFSPPQMKSATYPAGQTDETLSMVWDTSKYQGKPTYNGAYAVTATATSAVGETATQSTGPLVVNNPPATVSGVTVVLAQSVPVLSWAPNSEPDLLGYSILRSTAGNGYAVIDQADASATSYHDSTAPAGMSISYKVAAYRNSTVSGTISANPSSPTPFFVIPLPPSPQPGQSQSPSSSTAPAAGQVPAGSTAPGVVRAQLSPLPGIGGIPLPAFKGLSGSRSSSGTSLGTYDKLLPYGQRSGAQGADAAEPGSPTPITRGAGKSRYLAAALLLFVGAIHMIRAARGFGRMPSMPGMPSMPSWLRSPALLPGGAAPPAAAQASTWSLSGLSEPAKEWALLSAPKPV